MSYKRLIVWTFLSFFFILAGCSKENANDASDFTTEINDTGNARTITITGYTGTLKDVRIPSKIDNIPVTEIGNSAFFENQLTSVIIPNGVTNIGGYAFTNNQLESITISNSVIDIGSRAFANNLLTSVTIPNSVTRIGDYAFAGNQLTNVVIPNSVIYLGEGAFPSNKPLINGTYFTWIGENPNSREPFNICFTTEDTAVINLGGIRPGGGHAFVKYSTSNNIITFVYPDGSQLTAELTNDGLSLNMTMGDRRFRLDFERHQLSDTYVISNQFTNDLVEARFTKDGTYQMFLNKKLARSYNYSVESNTLELEGLTSHLIIGSHLVMLKDYSGIWAYTEAP